MINFLTISWAIFSRRKSRKHTSWVDIRSSPELRKQKSAETTQERWMNADTTHERTLRHDSLKIPRPETTSNAWLRGSPFNKDLDTSLENHIHNFQKLTRGFEILNSLVDVGKFIQSVRQLNAQLLQNKNPLAAIQIFSEFAKMPVNSKIVDKLIIAHWNANRISNKYIELREFLNKYKVDIMLINESKLSNKSKYSGYRGYTSYRKDRHRQGGGLLILV